MSVTVLSKQQWTPKQLLAAGEADPKPATLTAGSWIADLAALKKVILLCSACTHKFNPGRVMYRREKEFPICQGKCDGCNVFDSKCSWYIHETLYTEIRSTADERRALQRSREKRIKQGNLG